MVVQAAVPSPPGEVLLRRPSAVSRQSMMPTPVDVVVIWDVERQERVVPTANGPRATTHFAASGTSARPVSVRSLVQDSGSDVMHSPLRALRKQSTMVVPAVVKVMPDVARHERVFPTANGPRATVHPTKAGIISKPFKEPSSVQAWGRPVAHTDGAGPVAVGTQLVESGVVTVVGGVVSVLVAGAVVSEVGITVVQASLPSPRPMAVRRHDRMLEGSVTAVPRHSAAVPTANGPRASVHAATLPGKSAADAVGMSRHAWGRAVMQTPERAAFRQATMLAPAVVAPISAARQAAVSAVPRTPRAAVQRGTRGTRARPSVELSEAHATGRTVAQTGGAGTQLAVVDGSLVVVTVVMVSVGCVGQTVLIAARGQSMMLFSIILDMYNLHGIGLIIGALKGEDGVNDTWCTSNGRHNIGSQGKGAVVRKVASDTDRLLNDNLSRSNTNRHGVKGAKV